MSERDLLDQLVPIARDEDDLAADPRWERRARGDLRPEEEAELRALAARSRIGQAMLDATEPASGALLDLITASLGAGSSEAGAPAKVVSIDAGRAPRRSRRWAGGAVAGALALAAALALFLRTPALPQVPDFDLTLSAGELDQRSKPAGTGVPRFGPGSRVEIIVRPHAPVDGKVGVRGALVRGGEVRDFHPPMDIALNGAVHIEGTREVVFAGVPDGEWEIWLAVGRPDALPSRLPADRPSDPRAARILRASVILTPDR